MMRMDWLKFSFTIQACHATYVHCESEKQDTIDISSQLW